MEETALMLPSAILAVNEGLLRDELPRLDLLQENFSSVYVDAGFLADKRGLVVKLAILVREPKGKEVEERIYYPYTSLGPGEPIAAFVTSSSVTDNEKIRQPISYAIELASLLAIALKPEKVLEGGDDLVLVRHGPLFQLIYQYFTEPYVVEKRLATAALTYAGLDEEYAKSLAEVSEKDGRVVLGKLLLNLLIDLMEVTKARGYVIAGVVEDVRESKIMVAHVVAKLYSKIYKECYKERGFCSEFKELLEEAIKRVIYENLIEPNGDLIKRCLCIDKLDENLFVDPWMETVNYIENKYVAHEGKTPPAYIKKDELVELESVMLRGGSPLTVTDEDLFYTAYFLSDGKVPITEPLSGASRVRVLWERVIKESESLEKLSEFEKRFKYVYIAPISEKQEVRCKELMEIMDEPCEMAKVIRVPSPIRVEYLNTEREKVERLLAMVYYSSLTMGYAYPPQLLLVDKYSRVNPTDMILAASLAEEMGRRVRPLSIFAHGWSNRRSFI